MINHQSHRIRLTTLNFSILEKNINHKKLIVMKSLHIIILLTATLFCSSCLKDKLEPFEEPESVPVTLTGIEAAKISPNFDWKTTQDVKVVLRAKGKNGENLKAIFELVDQRNRLLAKGTPNQGGIYETLLTIPMTTTELTIFPNYLGLINQVTLPISGSVLEYEFNIDVSKMDFSNVIEQKESSNNRFKGQRLALETPCDYLYSYDVYGVPTTLESDDNISSDFLSQVNASLPEQRPVPDYHPQYIEDGINTDVRLQDSAAVYITFVHEGAGYRNALGFYTYDLSNPPTSASEIANCNVIFPNLSYTGSGGNMHSGQKVFLGNYPANTGIGWFIVSNGWTGSVVNMNTTTFYSNPDFNPESTADKRKHMVLIKDEARELLLMGFEDINRDLWGCDHDFNDAVFYVTANPYEAIITEDIPEIDVTDDADNDGVSDLYDDYPEDNTRCFNNYYPSEGNHSTLAFEDLWPSKGDYDYNDLVVDYQHNRVTNNQNVIIEMVSDFRIKGVLAGFKNNALAVELPLTPSRVQSVTGNRLGDNFFFLNSNGTELGQSKAVIPVFDHAGNNFTSATSPDTILITTTFSSGISLSELGGTPYNPFIIVNRDRGREVHLPGNAPTTLADPTKFGTYHDNTDVNVTNQTYKTSTQLPWAINLPESFNYPKESTPINTTYYHFIQWAESEGVFYSDWYEDKDGYRNQDNLSF